MTRLYDILIFFEVDFPALLVSLQQIPRLNDTVRLLESVLRPYFYCKIAVISRIFTVYGLYQAYLLITVIPNRLR